MLYTLQRNVIVKLFMTQPLGGVIFQLISDIAKRAVVHLRVTTTYLLWDLCLSFLVLHLWCEMKAFSFTMFVLLL